ncbi:MAG TPA: ubiquinol-cytochrome c reductase iron-sulfur subunit [Chloroflexota bacterium]|nr:ubiquinol-cytochrome c reductase iron-sulfur subunit [Chloroflexota bacterium]
MSGEAGGRAERDHPAREREGTDNLDLTQPQAHAEGEGPLSPERREFLTKLSLGLSALGAALVGVPFISFLLAPLFRRPAESWQVVGEVGGFRVGQTVQVTVVDPSPLAWAGLAERTAVWLRREGEEQFRAFAVNCTHLGCPVRWIQDASLFLCPCHGGVFYSDGTVAGGPPPRPLVEYQVRVQDGVVQILAGASPLA